MIATPEMMAVLASMILHMCFVTEPVLDGIKKSESNPQELAIGVIDVPTLPIEGEANPRVIESRLDVTTGGEANPGATSNFYGTKEGATTQEYYDHLRGMHPSRSFEQDQFSLDLINEKKSGKIDGAVRVYRWTYKGIKHVHAMVQTSSGGWQGPQPAEGYYGQVKFQEDFEYIR
jgi:hypothetical protein